MTWFGRVVRAAGAGLSALALSSCCVSGAASTLGVTLRPQETTMWCWAASGQMVMEFLNNNVAQCTQANNRFNRNDCPCSQCTNPLSNPPCVNGGWPEFDRYGFKFERTSDAALSWGDLTDELSDALYCGETPVAFSWHWNGGGGHMMAAVGYSTAGGVNYVTIDDPWAPCNGDQRIIPYTAYVSGTGYTHWDDFYRIRRK